MLRRFETKLLAGAMIVALLSIGLTAWLVSATTRTELRQGFERSLEVDVGIYQELLTYGQAHASWSAVQPTVADLATQNGRRIVLTTRRGLVLADSRQPSAVGTRRKVAQRASALIDPLAPVVVAYGPATIADEPDADSSADPPADPRATRAGAGVAEPVLLYLGPAETSPFSLRGSGRWRIAALALAVLAVAGAAAWWATRRVTRPVRAVAAAAGRVAGGDLSSRVEVRARDEIGALASSFNTMADALARNEHERRRLVADIAHELRNPLATLGGTLEAVSDGVLPLDVAVVGSLEGDVRLLQELVEDLSQLAAADAGHLRLLPEPVDVADLADEVAARYRPAADAAGVTLTVDRDAVTTPLVIEADARRLRQVLANLVSNALRHTTAAGHVTVRLAPAGRGALVEVADDGEGIGAADLPYVFEAFYRADPARSRHTGGSGLGLAVVHRLVVAHGGLVKVTSQLGAGTTFTVELPRAVPGVAAAGSRAGDVRAGDVSR